MAKPRIFISSTFYDLKQVRSSLEAFILGLGFDPVLSEKGSIAYSPDAPLDESCYREAQGCDIFVLIVGGRYGSDASSEKGIEQKGFYERYESITRKEYESAVERDIPIYVLVEKSVHSEYETFKRNRDNSTIKYAHVDSVNIFGLIDYVLSRPRNNPTYHFEVSSEIQTWLRDQWAGLFRELIRTRTDRAQISSLADQVADLSNISTTLKRYLEEVVERVGNKEQAQEIIGEEQARLAEVRELNELAKLDVVSFLRDRYSIPVEITRDMFTQSKTLDDLAERIEKEGHGELSELLTSWKISRHLQRNMNEVREALHLPPLSFAEEGSKKPATRKNETKALGSSDTDGRVVL